MLLILDDDEAYTKTLSLYIAEKIKVVKKIITFHDPLQAENFIKLNASQISVMLIDYRMPDLTGVDLIEKVQNEEEVFQIILLTAQIDFQLSQSIRRINIFDLIEKSVPLPIIIQEIQKAYIFSDHLRNKKKKLSEIYKKHNYYKFNENISALDQIVCDSSSMLKIKKDIQKISKSDAPCLISGESGTGKELIARAIYEESSRRNKKFFSLNCAAIPPDLLESELFGYKKGSFTGANKDKEGLFQSLENGTIFLDEVSEIPTSIQAKLLRFLQEGSVKAIGSNLEESINLRIIAASNKILKLEIIENRFREDLFYRLNVIEITIPPLRERKEDIELLFRYFLNFFSNLEKKKELHYEKDVVQILHDYSWPGNVRELKNITHRLVIFCENSTINIENLPVEISGYNQYSEDKNTINKIPISIKDYEKLSIINALKKANGDKEKAAGLIGISRASIYRKIKEYDIT